MPRPLISLAVIVRDQETLLESLLTGHRDLYDEAVVVDTGSRDGSAATAGRLGARVFSCRWRQDFAAARNESLRHCRGRWILVLDCDEAIALEDQFRLRSLLEDSPEAALVMEQRNYTFKSLALGFVPGQPDDPMAHGAPGYVPRMQIRGFPNGLGLRYEGGIHENIEASLVTYGLPKNCADIPVHHYGHLEGTAGHLRRIRRNGVLLRRESRLRPADPVLLTELATGLLAEGQPRLAAGIARRAIMVAPGHPELYQARLLLARIMVNTAPEQALELVEHALAERPDQVSCWVEAVRAHMVAGDSKRSRDLLRTGRRVFPGDRALAAMSTQVFQESSDNVNQGMA